MRDFTERKVVVVNDEATIYGSSLEDRPDADKVEIGTFFIIVGDLETIYQSDGNNWVVI